MENRDMERLTIMETQIKAFRWAIGLIFTLCTAWGYGVYAQSNTDGKEFAVIKEQVAAHTKEIKRTNVWLKETSDKTGNIDVMKKDIGYLVKGLDNIEKILRQVHNVQ